MFELMGALLEYPCVPNGSGLILVMSALMTGPCLLIIVIPMHECFTASDLKSSYANDPDALLQNAYRGRILAG